MVRVYLDTKVKKKRIFAKKNEMRTFNTSGPNIPVQHYTIARENLMAKGLNLVRNERYFTIWAPRQTGKSTYFRLLATELEKDGYKVCHVNIEHLLEAEEAFLCHYLGREMDKSIGRTLEKGSIRWLFDDYINAQDEKYVFIVDEIEGLNPEMLNIFLHTIRSAYHSRNTHALKSVILVGVVNITGIIQDNASPFNTNDNLEIPYFAKNEIYELLGQHEAETGQLFSPEVKEKIAYITGGQPGLVNGFGYNLVENYPQEKIFGYKQYLEIEKNYTSIYIDKNVSNIINKGKQHRKFIEKLLFDDRKRPFEIYDDRIKFLAVNGLIAADADKNITFNVPLYKKCLQIAFGPPLNGEAEHIAGRVNLSDYFGENGVLNIDNIIKNYQKYAKKRGFRYFMEKDENGKVTGLIESALIYSFDTYIQAFLQVVEGESYLEAQVGLGRSDLIVGIQGTKFVIEAKIFRDITQFKRGKIQLSYYLNSLGLQTGIYLVFMDNQLRHKEVKEMVETLNNVTITTYLVRYDVNKDFSEDLRQAENRPKRTYKKKEA